MSIYKTKINKEPIKQLQLHTKGTVIKNQRISRSRRIMYILKKIFSFSPDVNANYLTTFLFISYINDNLQWHVLLLLNKVNF